MVIVVVWTALLGAAVTWESWCRFANRGWLRLSDLCTALARHRAGQLLLIAMWAFVGWHLFARYTLPT